MNLSLQEYWNTSTKIKNSNGELNQKWNYCSTIIKNTNIYTYLLSFIVVCLVIYLIYYSYTCFYDNQYINTNIEKPIKSSDDDNCDDVFNVDKEVNKLIDLQDKYLSKIGSNK